MGYVGVETTDGGVWFPVGHAERRIENGERRTENGNRRPETAWEDIKEDKNR